MVEEQNQEAQNLEAPLKEEKSGFLSKPLVKIGFLVIGFLMIAAVAFILVKTILMPRYQAHQIHKLQQPSAAPSEESNLGHIFLLGNITVNLKDKEGRRIMVAEYAIESVNEKIIEEVRKREPQLRDEFIRYLRQHTAAEVLDPAFQTKSKVELTALLNSYLQAGQVEHLYYNQLILQ